MSALREVFERQWVLHERNAEEIRWDILSSFIEFLRSKRLLPLATDRN